MNLYALVIDDKYVERKTAYERLRSTSARFGGFGLKFDYLKHPNDLGRMLRTRHYHAILLDAVLDDEPDWTNFSISLALREVGLEVPIALLSAQWDETNSEQINEAWKAPNCRTFLHWRDIDPKGNGQIDFAVRPFLRMISDSLNFDTSLTLGSSDSIWIVHISDIQIGGFNEADVLIEANRKADLILERTNDISPTFIALTGDVAEYATFDQYARASEWISYFLERLGADRLPHRRLLHVPGNHDVNVSLAGAARLRPHDVDDRLEIELASDVVQPNLLPLAYAPVKQFERHATGRSFLRDGDLSDQSLAWVEARFRHLGVVFYGINTAQPANPFGVPLRTVDASALARISVDLKPVCNHGRPLVVGLGHHSPVPVSVDPNGSVQNPEAFQKFFKSNPQTALFLHGHTHEHEFAYSSNAGHRLVRSAASTVTKEERARPRDTLRGFNLLELQRTDGIVTSLKGTSFGWVSSSLVPVGTGEWTRHSDGMFVDVVHEPNVASRRGKR